MELIKQIVRWCFEHPEFFTVGIAILVRWLEKWSLQKKQKKAVNDAYGRALESAISQLKRGEELYRWGKDSGTV